MAFFVEALKAGFPIYFAFFKENLHCSYFIEKIDATIKCNKSGVLILACRYSVVTGGSGPIPMMFVGNMCGTVLMFGVCVSPQQSPQ